MKNILLFYLICHTGIFICNAQSIRVMSYNMRFDNAKDGINSWEHRKDSVIGLLKRYDADIIGTQELLTHQVNDIQRNMPGYAFTGVGREDGNKGGEYAAIFFDSTRLSKISEGHFWLSETPNIAGSKGWDAANARMATWCGLKEKSTGKTYYVFNTHFDHRGKKARKESALLLNKIIDFIAGENAVILTGDLNTGRRSCAYKTLQKKLTDAGRKSDNDEGTFCGFNVSGRCRILDYIMYNEKLLLQSYEVIHDNNGVYYFSDHRPILSNLIPVQ